MFKTLDTNKDGRLSGSEIQIAFRKMGIQIRSVMRIIIVIIAVLYRSQQFDFLNPVSCMERTLASGGLPLKF